MCLNLLVVCAAEPRYTPPHVHARQIPSRCTTAQVRTESGDVLRRVDGRRPRLGVHRGLLGGAVEHLVHHPAISAHHVVSSTRAVSVRVSSKLSKQAASGETQTSVAPRVKRALKAPNYLPHANHTNQASRSYSNAHQRRTLPVTHRSTATPSPHECSKLTDARPSFCMMMLNDLSAHLYK